jgi:hypothetical protein
MKTEQLTNFLNSLTEGITNEQKKLYISIIEKGGFSKFETPEEFYFAVIHPYNDFVSGFIKSEISSNKDVEFCLLHYNYIESSFCRFFQDFEGSPCCADKSRSIVKCLIDYFKNGNPIKFDYTQKYTYHLPEKILKTHEEIISMYEGLRDMYYGNNVKYAKALKNLVTKLEKDES